MASWGKAKLSPAALGYIDEVNKGLEEADLDGLQKTLLQAALRENREHCSDRYALFNDLLETTVNSSVGQSQEKVEVVLPVEVDPQTVVSKIVNHVVSGSENINIVIELVSNLNDQILDDVVVKSWSSLTEDVHKKSFIIAMSAARNSALSVSSSVLLPLFSGEVASRNALSTFGPALEWLEHSISKTLILPLILNENSPIARDMTYCEAFFTSLTESQRTDALITWSSSFQGELLSFHLRQLSTILELPIDSSAASSVCRLLAPCMSKLSHDRLVGKIVLSLISILTPSTPSQVIHDVSNLASQYQGPLRFHHKKALDKLTAQLHS